MRRLALLLVCMGLSVVQAALAQQSALESVSDEAHLIVRRLGDSGFQSDTQISELYARVRVGTHFDGISQGGASSPRECNGGNFRRALKAIGLTRNGVSSVALSMNTSSGSTIIEDFPIFIARRKGGNCQIIDFDQVITPYFPVGSTDHVKVEIANSIESVRRAEVDELFSDLVELVQAVNVETSFASEVAKLAELEVDPLLNNVLERLDRSEFWNYNYQIDVISPRMGQRTEGWTVGLGAGSVDNSDLISSLDEVYTATDVWIEYTPSLFASCAGLNRDDCNLLAASNVLAMKIDGELIKDHLTLAGASSSALAVDLSTVDMDLGRSTEDESVRSFCRRLNNPGTYPQHSEIFNGLNQFDRLLLKNAILQYYFQYNQMPSIQVNDCIDSRERQILDQMNSAELVVEVDTEVNHSVNVLNILNSWNGISASSSQEIPYAADGFVVRVNEPYYNNLGFGYEARSLAQQRIILGSLLFQGAPSCMTRREDTDGTLHPNTVGFYQRVRLRSTASDPGDDEARETVLLMSLKGEDAEVEVDEFVIGSLDVIKLRMFGTDNQANLSSDAMRFINRCQ